LLREKEKTLIEWTVVTPFARRTTLSPAHNYSAREKLSWCGVSKKLLIFIDYFAPDL
jgi:hypothetical protein